MTAPATERNPILVAIPIVGAIAVVLAVAVFRDLPSRIDNGERARVAIGTLDEVRRPFLKIQDSVSALMNEGYDESVRADFRSGIAHARNLIAEFKSTAAYNPAVLHRVDRLAIAFEVWAEDQKAVFDLAERGEPDGIEALHALETVASKGFSLTMSLLGDAEGPIHDDMDRGAEAVTELVVLGSILVVGLAAAAFFLMYSRNRALQNMLAETRRTRALARESELRLNAFFNEAPAGLAIIDPEYRYVKINETLARMSGLAPEQHIGKRLSEILPPALAEAIEGEVRKTLESGEAEPDSMVSAIAPDGTEHHWISSQFPIQGLSGETEAVGAIVVEITRQKRAEEELIRLNAELEQRVEERTEALRDAQAELLRSERLATLGQLTGSVAHELRNPLGAVMSSLGVIRLKSEKAGLNLEKALNRADRGIRRCDGIVTELLDFARSRGLQPEPTPLDAWLGELLDEQELPKGVAVVRDCGLDDAIVSIDREEVRRAVVNVIDNACDAMTEGGGDNGIAGPGKLTVATRRNGARIEIEIDDTGPGIPEDVLPKICEPLFSTKSFGVGLGLPIVRQITEQHGGGLEISTTPGQGTRAILWLPVSAEQQLETRT